MVLYLFLKSRIFQTFRCASSERTDWSNVLLWHYQLPAWCTDKYLHTGHYLPIVYILQILTYLILALRVHVAYLFTRKKRNILTTPRAQGCVNG